MDEFSLEKKSELIYNVKTRNYFQEVLSSYYNGNYRSAVVILWSVVVCDLVYKLESLIDIYNDLTAKNILDELTKLQEHNQKSPEWETELLKKVHEKTQLLEPSDYENLCYLQRQRHLSAHPILSKDRELHIPNKDTVRSLIRNSLDGILVKPPLYGKKIFDKFISDLENDQLSLTTDKNLKIYLNSRYFSRFSLDIELFIFRALWKLVFLTENDDCSRNRKINYRVIVIITSRNKSKIFEKISVQSERDYYSNIASKGAPLLYLIAYLCKFPELYEYLTEDAKFNIQQCIDNNPEARVLGWFTKESFEIHFDDITNWIESDESPDIAEETWQKLQKILKSYYLPESELMLTKVLAAYYCASRSFTSADERFNIVIDPYLGLFNKESLIFLLDKISENSQTYGRRKATKDHLKIKNRVNEIFGEDFDWNAYPNL